MSTSAYELTTNRSSQPSLVVVEPAEAAAHHRRRVGRHPEAERAVPEGQTDLRGDVVEARAAERSASAGRGRWRGSCRHAAVEPTMRYAAPRGRARASGGTTADRRGRRGRARPARESTRRRVPSSSATTVGGPWYAPRRRLSSMRATCSSARDRPPAAPRIRSHSDASQAPLAPSLAPSRSRARSASTPHARSTSDVPRDRLRSLRRRSPRHLGVGDRDLGQRLHVGDRSARRSRVGPRRDARCDDERAVRERSRQARRPPTIRRVGRSSTSLASRSEPTSSSNALRGAHDEERGEDRDLRRELGRLRRDQHGREKPDADRVGASPYPRSRESSSGR